MRQFFRVEVRVDLGVSGKVFMLAGASRGLGYAVARVLAAEGARVAIGARTAADVQAAAERLRQETGAEVHAWAVDARAADSLAAWFAAVDGEYGRLDGVLINAGGPPPGRFDDFSDEDWQAAFELTLMSAVRMARLSIPRLRRQGSGAILALTSSSVREPIEHLLLSNVLRSGVASLVKSLSRQLAPENIRVNSIIPGLMATDRLRALDENVARSKGISLEQQQAEGQALIPMGRYGEPMEFGRAGAFLLSPAASYITGTSLVVDGGSMRSV